MAAKKILALSAIRSDYDLMSTLYKRLAAEPDTDFKLLVSGAHLSPAHGYSVRHILEDGIPLLSQVETLISSDSRAGRLKTASNLLSGSVDLVKDFAPDAILIAGDREDVLVGAMMGGFLGIPTVHFFGGDHAADGHIDNPVRHATSKLASLHFVSHEEHKQRLLSLGEEPRRIHVTGSLALDKFMDEPALDRAEVASRVGAPASALAARWAVLIFHPIAEEEPVAADYIETACRILLERGFHVFLGAPNTDPGNHRLVDALDRLDRDPRVTFYRNIPRNLFVNLLRQSALITGNSSAGLLEAPSLRMPTINLGKRQRGRLAAQSVIFADGSAEAFSSALDRIAEPAFQRELASLANPYGDGRSTDRVVSLLRTIDLQAFLRKATDPLAIPHESS
ncbi:UDP-N-acetylglucosamine 2-epimerase (hydrolyzing) [Chromobacterium violaceum]|uniref:UDP-N-acetylglucosamine 2-epimerase n=1 Tax=Chromobacterium violaceum TaxID=536 RepID=UPI0009F12D71|nr:UDP-N-acetylglucosamine 2-epimerase [Chromobacterium violaceum]OQS08493.1 UDP-N-acetylglucosamine 2-epimerase (hydrolyzing) [Chromobacterium violaceum]OQS21689.1 UDP-N-acetylglucosamine 2-epimerase (hydrolyzing) [Chromobacterium violaceum]